MNKHEFFIFILLTYFSFSLYSCKSFNINEQALEVFKEYYTASKSGTDSKWKYTADTVKLWFDERSGEPILQSKEKKAAGKWKEWDEEMHATSYYDTIWYDKNEHAVKGYFYENNDFYDLIGKAPTKTLQTYWFNEDNKITEILIYWIPEENTTTDVYLKPIVAWAMQYDSTEIQELYPDNKLIPSKENARRWKSLLLKYHAATDSIK